MSLTKKAMDISPDVAEPGNEQVSSTTLVQKTKNIRTDKINITTTRQMLLAIAYFILML